MARFIGTSDEFYELFGESLLTKAVEAYTKEYKKMVGNKCQDKGKDSIICKPTLHAAHLHTHGTRKEIAYKILEKHINKVGLIDIDLFEFLDEFYKAHLPLHTSFRILCSAHHGVYDTGKRDKNPYRSKIYGMPKQKEEREGKYSIEFLPDEKTVIDKLSQEGKCDVIYNLMDGSIVKKIWKNNRGIITENNIRKNIASKSFVKRYNKRIYKITISITN